MRKRDREVREFSEIVDIVNRSQVMRMATCGEPYIVPLSFGYEAEDGVLTLYFHCAAEGTVCVWNGISCTAMRRRGIP